MAEQKTQDTGVNWPVVLLGILALAVAVIAIRDDNIFLRVVVAAAIMGLTFYWSRAREEPVIENPLFEQLHAQQHGLDRRKYGRLRSTTDELLECIRQMNRIAVEGREGKLSPRHTQAELDRLAAKLRDIIDDIRKTAGVPTPLADPAVPVARRQVVIPKAKGPAARGSAADDDPVPPREFYDDADRKLDDLVARAEAEAESRTGDSDEERRETRPKPRGDPDAPDR